MATSGGDLESMLGVCLTFHLTEVVRVIESLLRAGQNWRGKKVAAKPKGRLLETGNRNDFDPLHGGRFASISRRADDRGKSLLAACDRSS